MQKKPSYFIASMLLIAVANQFQPLRCRGENSHTATTAPATDISTPVATLKTLQRASRNQDRQTIVGLFFGENDREAALAGVLADMIITTRKLELMIEKQFSNDDTVKTLFPSPNNENLLDQAIVKISGDSAFVVADGQKKEIHFHRSNINGKTGWRLIVREFAIAEMDIDRQILLLQKSETVIEEIRREVELGKFKTAADAHAAMQKQLANIMMRAATRPSTTRSTTIPATAPAAR